MILFLSSSVIKVLLLYLSFFVLSAACPFQRFVKAELNALYASFSKCFNFSCKGNLKRLISKYFYDLQTVEEALKLPDFMIVEINLLWSDNPVSNVFDNLKSDSHLPKKFCYICFIETPLKMMKNASYFSPGRIRPAPLLQTQNFRRKNVTKLLIIIKLYKASINLLYLSLSKCSLHHFNIYFSWKYDSDPIESKKCCQAKLWLVDMWTNALLFTEEASFSSRFFFDISKNSAEIQKPTKFYNAIKYPKSTQNIHKWKRKISLRK